MRVAILYECQAPEGKASAPWSAVELPCLRIIHVIPQTYKLCHTSASGTSLSVRNNCLLAPTARFYTLLTVLHTCIELYIQATFFWPLVFPTQDITASMAALTATPLLAAGWAAMLPEGPRRVTEVRSRVRSHEKHADNS